MQTTDHLAKKNSQNDFYPLSSYDLLTLHLSLTVINYYHLVDTNQAARSISIPANARTLTFPTHGKRDDRLGLINIGMRITLDLLLH